MKAKRLFALGGRSFLLAVVSLAIGEMSLRVYHSVVRVPLFYDDSYSRFRAKPYSRNFDFSLNSLGFKDIEFDQNRTGSFRILGIGDSFAFGAVPYEYTYLTVLEDMLKQSIGSVEVLNMGIPGTGPRDYLSLLMNEGLAFHPDLVLVSFFIGNDFTESSREGRQRAFFSYSYVATLLRFVLHVQPKYRGTDQHTPSEYRDDRPTMPYPDYIRLIRQRSLIYIESLDILPKLAKDALYYLSETKTVCDRSGSSMLTVLIPDELQLRPGLQQVVRESYKKEYLRNEGWDTTRPNRLLAAGLERIGVDYIDLYLPFLRASQERRLYIPYDSHWNIAGNRLAAELIATHIEEEYVRNRGLDSVIGHREASPTIAPLPSARAQSKEVHR